MFKPCFFFSIRSLFPSKVFSFLFPPSSPLCLSDLIALLGVNWLKKLLNEDASLTQAPFSLNIFSKFIFYVYAGRLLPVNEQDYSSIPEYENFIRCKFSLSGRIRFFNVFHFNILHKEIKYFLT